MMLMKKVEENTFPKKQKKTTCFHRSGIRIDKEGSNKRGASFKGGKDDIVADKHCNNPAEGNIQQVKCMMGQMLHSLAFIY